MYGWLSPFGPGKVPDTGLSVPQILSEKKLLQRRWGLLGNRKNSELEKSKSGVSMRPARTPEARENQLIALAIDQAEKQLREGTASSQVITHFLKLGSSRERMEKELLEEKTKLAQAKTEALESGKRMTELFEQAMDALRGYRGDTDEEDEE